MSNFPLLRLLHETGMIRMIALVILSIILSVRMIDRMMKKKKKVFSERPADGGKCHPSVILAAWCLKPDFARRSCLNYHPSVILVGFS